MGLVSYLQRGVVWMTEKPTKVQLHAKASYANDWASGWKCRTPNPFHTTNEVRLANEWREAYDAALREHELTLQRQKAKAGK